MKLKNLRTVGGISLVARAAQIATSVDEIDCAVVSTDHEGIALAAVEAGILAPFRRPTDLSGDQIGDLDVLNHALREMEKRDGVNYDIVVMLQPTSPSRTAAHVRATIEHLISGGFDAVWTVSETDGKSHPLKQLNIVDGVMDYYDPRAANIVARQQLSPVYHRNGIAYAITRDCLLEKKSIKGDRCGAVLIEGPVANIDSEVDLAWAEFLFNRAG